MKFCTILIISLLMMNSCYDKKTISSEFPNEFLSSHNWMIYSNDKSDKIQPQWLFFTPQNKFYRFSQTNKSYIIDSALNWNRYKVSTKNEEKFKITIIDSDNISLKTQDTIYYANRRSKFDKKHISQNISNNKSKLLINGKWVLDSKEKGVFSMSYYCNDITPGAIFDFKENGILEVYLKNSSEYCHEYDYGVFQNLLVIYEFDVRMEYPITELSNTLLTFKSHHHSEGSYEARRKAYEKSRFKVFFKKYAE